MSNTKKRTGVQLTTPAGIWVYPYLNKPDYKYKKEGKYSVKQRYSEADPAVQAFYEKLEKMRDDFLVAEVARLKADKKAALAAELKPAEIRRQERDPETGEPTGYLTMVASMNASGTREDGSSWTQKPSIFDAKGRELKNPPFISGGTEGKVSAIFDPYVDNKTKEVGIGIRLLGVQVLKLVSGGVRTFSGLGFQAEDGDEIEDQAMGFSDESGGDDEGAGGGSHDDI